MPGCIYTIRATRQKGRDEMNTDKEGFFAKKRAELSRNMKQAMEAVGDKTEYYIATSEGREKMGRGACQAAKKSAEIGGSALLGVAKGYTRKVSDYAKIAGDLYNGRYKAAAGTVGERCKRKAQMGMRLVKDTATVAGSGCKIAYAEANGKNSHASDWQNLKHAGQGLVVVMVAVLIGAEFADTVEHDHMDGMAGAHTVTGHSVYEGEVHSEAGDDVLATETGMVPEYDINTLPGVEHGMLVDDSTGALEKIAQTGEIHGTHHVADVVRSAEVKTEFLRMNGYMEEPAGYEVHHIVPLSEGGADSPDNMVLLSEKDHEYITQLHRAFYQWNA